VYDKPFRITQEVTIAASPELKARASADELLTIKGTVRYQACDDKVCYLPTNVSVEWSIPLTASKPPQRN
jgi:DsbC/DsbD-like thiol-disulfide interchange protein